MAFPKLKSKIFGLNFTKSANGSQKTSPRRMESLIATRENVELLESMDLSKFTKIKKSNLNEYIDKEINKLEKELDISEINTFGATVNCEQEFRLYKLYLEKLSSIIGKKDFKLGNILLRGVIGCEKAFKKLSIQNRAEVSRPSKQHENIYKKEISTQTITIEKVLAVPDLLTSPELENIKSLAGTLDKIKLTRISNQLEEVYESLNNMYTDIPSPSESPLPELPEFPESNENKKIINLQITVIRNNIKNILKNPEIKKLGIDKEVQTESDKKRRTIVALVDMNKEKELGLLKFKGKNESLQKDKSKLEESLIRNSEISAEMERKLGDSDIKLSKLKQSMEFLQEKNFQNEIKISKFESKLTESNQKISYLTNIIESLKITIKKKQSQLQNSLDQLYNIQIAWGISEKKLKNIEKEWKKQTNSEFVFKDINIDAMQEKRGIKKIQIDNPEDELKKIANNEFKDVKIDSVSPNQAFNVENTNFDRRFSVGVKVNLHSSKNNLKKGPSKVKDDLNKSQSPYRLEIPSNDISVAKGQKKVLPEEIELESDSSKDNISHKNSNSNINRSNEIDPPRKIVAPKKSKKNESKHEKKVEKKTEKKIEKKNEKKVDNKPRDSKDLTKIIIPDKKFVSQNFSYQTEKIFSYEGNKSLKKLKEPYIIVKNNDSENKQTKNTYTNNIENTSNLPNLQNNHENFNPTPIPNENQITKKFENEKNTETKNIQEKLPEPIEIRLIQHNKSRSNDFSLTKLGQIPSPLIPESIENYAPYSYRNQNNSYSPILNLETTDKNMKSFDRTLDSPYKDIQIIRSPSISKQNLLTPFEDPLKPSATTLRLLKNSTESKSQLEIAQANLISSKSNPSHKNHLSLLPKPPVPPEWLKEAEELSNFLKETEKKLYSCMTEDQKELYMVLISKEEEYKIMKALNYSKATQCLLLDSNNDQFEKIRNKDKYKLLLEQLFEYPAEIDFLSPQARREIASSLKGHETEKCPEVCEHLQRALQVKLKFRGHLYPLKVIKM